ncbi:hypothetical protein AV889_26595, partial [Escherichia coli]
FYYYQRCDHMTRNLLEFLINIGSESTTASLNMTANGLAKNVTEHGVDDIDHAHTALRSKR